MVNFINLDATENDTAYHYWCSCKPPRLLQNFQIVQKGLKRSRDNFQDKLGSIYVCHFENEVWHGCYNFQNDKAKSTSALRQMSVFNFQIDIWAAV